jgi:hypothetical protein
MTILHGHDTYQVFLTIDGELDLIIRFSPGRPIGTITKLHECPWPVRQQIEDNLEPLFY